MTKTTVYNHCQKLGIDTSNGLSESAVNPLRTELDLVLPANEQLVGAELMLPIGHHRAALDLLAQPTEIPSSDIRGSDSPLTHFENEDIDLVEVYANNPKTEFKGLTGPKVQQLKSHIIGYL